MTVYVDDIRILATVGPYTDRWSHLFTDSDDLTELHTSRNPSGYTGRGFKISNPARTTTSPTDFDTVRSPQAPNLFLGETFPPCGLTDVSTTPVAAHDTATTPDFEESHALDCSPTSSARTAHHYRPRHPLIHTARIAPPPSGPPAPTTAVGSTTSPRCGAVSDRSAWPGTCTRSTPPPAKSCPLSLPRPCPMA